LAKIAAIILLIVFVGPAIVLGLLVSPWFLLLMLGLIVIPLLFIKPGGAR
jgi:hypothetical protein